jgi:hypothetical protein
MKEFKSNCLAVECPELCLDWHPIKNLPLTTTNTAYGSGKRVWWKCHICSYEWEAYISNRRKQYKYPGQKGNKCPNCIGRIINLENSFASVNPNLIEEWHPTKNLPETPYSIAPTTVKKYHWICTVCENEWEAGANQRSCGCGCPLCGEFKNRKLSKSTEWKALNQKIILKSKRVKGPFIKN